MRCLGSGYGWKTLRGALFLACLGCAEDEASATEIFCDALCERAVECRATPTESTCKSHCQSSATGTETLRVDAMELYADCLRTGSCGEFSDDSVFERCWESAFDSLSATNYCRTFCREFATRLFECGYHYSVEACENYYGKYTDDTLERLRQCVGRSLCGDVEICVEEVLGG